MGVSAYLQKPFERKQLFDIVSKIIQQSVGTEAYIEKVVNCQVKSSACAYGISPSKVGQVNIADGL
jgi:YesN/AraC family two-component response regulator